MSNADQTSELNDTTILELVGAGSLRICATALANMRLDALCTEDLPAEAGPSIFDPSFLKHRIDLTFSATIKSLSRAHRPGSSGHSIHSMTGHNEAPSNLRKTWSRPERSCRLQNARDPKPGAKHTKDTSCVANAACGKRPDSPLQLQAVCALFASHLFQVRKTEWLIYFLCLSVWWPPCTSQSNQLFGSETRHRAKHTGSRAIVTVITIPDHKVLCSEVYFGCFTTAGRLVTNSEAAQWESFPSHPASSGTDVCLYIIVSDVQQREKFPILLWCASFECFEQA